MWSVLVCLCLLTRNAKSTFDSTISSRIRRDTNDDNSITEVFNDCKCVYYYQCDTNNHIITNGETIIIYRFDAVERINCKGGRFEGELVCCKSNSTGSSLDPPLKLPNIIDVTESKTSTKHLLCGSQRTILNNRISIGENDLSPINGEFPWIATIFRKGPSNEDFKFFSSGSLIHPKVIMTANHYFHRKLPEDFKVILNGNIELASVGNYSSDERNVVEIIHHPDYYAGAYFYDVALLILDEPYIGNATNIINTICLPPSGVDLQNVTCLLAGWGYGSGENGQRLLKRVELPFVDHNRCQDLLRKTRMGAWYELHQSFICAGGEKGKDACNGDGGSPLMCPFPSENRYFQMGIVSWGVGCGEADIPGVYANVGEFKDWIIKEFEKRQLAD